MDWGSLVGPAVVAAGVSGVISVVGLIVSTRTARAIHSEKLAFDRDLAERKFAFDKDLAERKRSADSQLAEHKSAVDADLAERKFKYDRELHDHKRRVEQAEAVLAEFFQAADVIRMIRSPASSKSEAANRQRGENESEEEANDKDTYFVPFARIRQNSEFISGLMSKKYRSRALLGDEIVEAFNAIHEVLIRVQVSASTLSNMVGRGKVAMERNQDLWRRCQADIWYSAPGEDELEPMVNRALEVADRVCRPILDTGRQA